MTVKDSLTIKFRDIEDSHGFVWDVEAEVYFMYTHSQGDQVTPTHEDAWVTSVEILSASTYDEHGNLLTDPPQELANIITEKIDNEDSPYSSHRLLEVGRERRYEEMQ